MTNSHAWRDIYSKSAWDKILLHCEISKAVVDNNSVQDSALAPLTNLILQYHAIPKDDLKLFNDRCKRLKEIESAAQAFLDKVGGEARKKPGKQKILTTAVPQPRRIPPKTARGSTTPTAPTAPSTPLKKVPIEPWIHSLARRAAKKVGYLEILTQYYGEKKGKSVEESPSAFEAYIIKKITSFNLRSNTTALPLVPGARMEQQDPLHRNIELTCTNNANWAKMWKSNGGLGEFFLKWLGTDTKRPFWIWLEGEAVCTSTPMLDQGGLEMKAITSVTYPDMQMDFWVVKPLGGRMAGTTVQKLGPDETFRTSVFPIQFKGTSMANNASKMGGEQSDGAAAYVWSKDGSEVYSAQHVAGEFHHSSFTGGKKVKCAGIWQTNQNGQVTCVTRDSGHYKPTEEHLKEFLRWLNGGYGGPSVLHPDAHTFDMGGLTPFDEYKKVSEFIK